MWDDSEPDHNQESGRNTIKEVWNAAGKELVKGKNQRACSSPWVSSQRSRVDVVREAGVDEILA